MYDTDITGIIAMIHMLYDDTEYRYRTSYTSLSSDPVLYGHHVRVRVCSVD